jgi:hypothetical protein
MAATWKRPSLGAIELVWRFVAWSPLFLLVLWGLPRMGIDIKFNTALLGPVSAFHPVVAVAALREFFSVLKPLETTRLIGWVVALVVVWLLASTVGRAMVLRRMEPGLKARWGTLLALGTLRTASVVAIAAFWMSACWWVIRTIVLKAVAAGLEPNLILAFGILVSGTLVLFVLWCTVSWWLQLAPVVSMTRGTGMGASLREARRNPEVRSKLMEINMVMGVVKVCLVVLGMVLSACPLPFESVESQNFLFWWTVFAVLLYLAVTDIYQAVRAAAYLRLWQAYEEKQ